MARTTGDWLLKNTDEKGDSSSAQFPTSWMWLNKAWVEDVAMPVETRARGLYRTQISCLDNNGWQKFQQLAKVSLQRQQEKVICPRDVGALRAKRVPQQQLRINMIRNKCSDATETCPVHAIKSPTVRAQRRIRKVRQIALGMKQTIVLGEEWHGSFVIHNFYSS